MFDAGEFEGYLPKLEVELNVEANDVYERPADELVSSFRTLNRRLAHHEKIRTLVKAANT
ncbi:MAG: hypothetical protein B7Y80_17590 [Hyphomicrobium sp. 32-62-53]|nr:MAG: hypothetical protein B7Z29_17215 [Hyphomicrobium sp. 12-62-95]OYX97963.1 MAG: hypothetical protein B7Y80_17590 [Hyphomicrobium sp. 32-62-53]